MSTFFNADSKMIDLFKIKKSKINNENTETKVENNQQKNTDIVTQTVDETAKIDTQNFDLDSIDDLEAKPQAEENVENKLAVGVNDKQQKETSTSNADAVNFLKQSLPHNLLEKINDKLGDIDPNSADYNEKFIEVAFQIMGDRLFRGQKPR